MGAFASGEPPVTRETRSNGTGEEQQDSYGSKVSRKRVGREEQEFRHFHLANGRWSP